MKSNLIERALSFIGYEKRSTSIGPTDAFGIPYGYAIPSMSMQSAMQLSVVYRCVDVVSDAVASQLWDVLEYNKAEGWAPNELSDTAYMLNYNPNPGMTRYTLMKTLVSKVLLLGDGFLQIHRTGTGDPEWLELINAPVKMFIRDDGTIYYKVGEPEQAVPVEDEDMIHILNFTYDGYTGVSTLKHAALSMGLANAAEGTAKGFFSGGANNSLVISVKGKLDKAKAKEIKKAFSEASDPTTGNPGGVVVVEDGLTFASPLTIAPADAQMLETRQFNIVELCRFFGTHPSKAFDNSNLTYTNIESFQLGFLTDTISSWDSKIEAEFNRKLLRPSKRIKTRLNLSINELLRANMDAKANYISKMFQCGGFTVNEVRKQCGMPKSDDEMADKPMIQINLQAISAFSAKPKPVEKKAPPVDKNTNLKTDTQDAENPIPKP